MLTIALFLATAFLWGAGALITTSQAAGAAVSLSVALRMTLVGAVMLGAGVATGSPLHVARAERPWLAAQGALFFGLAFIAFYKATQAIPSGVAALVLSSAPFFTAGAAWVLLRAPVGGRMLAGIACGSAGLTIVSLPHLMRLGFDGHTARGFGWALLAAASTGFGTALSARNRARGIAVLAQMGWGALCGAGFALAWALAAGVPLAVRPDRDFLLGLVYLALVASCATFGMYFTLVGRIGPARAAYVLTVVPLVALALSVLFEGLHIDARLIAGATAILIGNVLVLSA